MSTQYRVLTTSTGTLILDERSSTFDLDFERSTEGMTSMKKCPIDIYQTLAFRVSADQIQAAAIKMLQAVLYNVADPEAKKAEILKIIEGLHA